MRRRTCVTGWQRQFCRPIAQFLRFAQDDNVRALAGPDLFVAFDLPRGYKSLISRVLTQYVCTKVNVQYTARVIIVTISASHPLQDAVPRGENGVAVDDRLLARPEPFRAHDSRSGGV